MTKRDLEKRLQAPAVGTSSLGGENASYSINKLSETTMFISSGNPNHQIFMLQLCSLLFDVGTLNSVEEKLFSCGFVYYFVSVYCTDKRALVRYIRPGLPILRMFLKLVSLKYPENSQLPMKSISVTWESMESTNLNWNIPSVLIL